MNHVCAKSAFFFYAQLIRQTRTQRYNDCPFCHFSPFRFCWYDLLGFIRHRSLRDFLLSWSNRACRHIGLYCRHATDPGYPGRQLRTTRPLSTSTHTGGATRQTIHVLTKNKNKKQASKSILI